jgi:UDP-N-acetylglucosamine transferase subunit ALG13
MTKSRPFVFATVGTDHHPFHRLVEWVDVWYGERAADVRCLIQTGTSRPPSKAEWRDYLGFEEMTEAASAATAVVCHGGPGTIMDVRHRGLIPIVMPRQSGLGEHVDDHQVAFTRRLDELGEIRLVSSKEHLAGLLEEAIVHPDRFRSVSVASETLPAVRRLEELVDALFSHRSTNASLETHGG